MDGSRLRSSANRSVRVREALPHDAGFFLRVRNQPSVRQASFSTVPIDLPTHRRWYATRLRDRNCRMYVVESPVARPVGVVRFTRRDRRTAEVHIALLSGQRRRRRGSVAFRQALCMLNRDGAWDQRRVLAVIRSDNARSIHFFSHLGFRPVRRAERGAKLVELMRPAIYDGLLLFVDAGREVGMGHLMRELSLYPFLRKQAITPLLVVRRLGGPVPEARLKKVLAAAGASEARRSTQWGEFLSKNDVGAVVFDTLEPPPNELVAAVKVRGLSCIVVGYYASVPEWADACFDPYGTPEASFSAVSMIRDPAYAILSKPFAKFRARGGRFEVRPSGHRVLMLPGGGNTRGMVFKLVDAMRQLPSEYHVSLITGPLFTRESELRRELRRVSCPVRHESGLSQREILDRMRNSDLAVLSFGRSADEARAVGLPCLLLSSSPLNRRGAEEAQRKGGAISLGDFRKLSGASIARQIVRLMEDASQRSRMSREGRALIDGRGAERVAALMARWLKGGVS